MAAECNSKFVKQLAGIYLISFVLLLTAANISQATLINWDNNDGAGDQHWGVASNWHGGVIPYVNMTGTHQDDAQIIATDSDAVIYDATDANNGLPRYVFFIPIGVGAGVSGEMYMNGGSLYTPYGLTLNKATPAAGNTANSTLHMSGGLLHLGPFPGYTGYTQGYLTVRSGTGTVDMTDGTIECESLQIPWTNAPADTVATVNLDGGVIKANSTLVEPLDIDSVGTGVLNITGGKLILKGDKRTTVNGYVSNSKIVAYPGYTGHKVVNVDYDNLSDANTTVTASLTEPNQAWNPQPIDTHPQVRKSVVLSWTPGDGADSHEVYFGTSFSDVDEGLVTPEAREPNNYSLSGLSTGQTYYWRVDEVNEPVTTKGVVWSFTVTNKVLATNPNPANGATGVSTSATLSWTGADDIDAHDVYFGISFGDVRDATSYSVLPGRGRQAGTSYNPGTLVAGQTYYWRIDEYDGSDVYKGPVWSFTATPPAAQAVTPPYLGDLIGYSDGVVTWEDMNEIADAWLLNNCDLIEDLDRDCWVNLKDYSLLAKDWLKSPPEYTGTVYYVATSGNDSNPGTSSQPWATIQKAAGVMTAGDTVIVRPGTYYGQVTVANSGDSQGCGLGDSPITFLADPSGDVILNANGSGNNGFYIVGKTYVVIDGFKITGGRDGVFFDGDGYNYSVIRNCKIYSNGRDGIRIYEGDRVTVEKCLLYGNTTGVGIKSVDSAGELLVNKCGIYGNNRGLDLKGSSDVNDCIITNNTTIGVQGDASQVVTYSDVWNNVTDCNGGTSAGTGCINSDPLYVSAPTDFHLSGGSPCIGAATDGTDMGYKYPPTANAGMDRTAYVDEAVTFDGSASRGSITSYDWDFGDTNTDSGQVVTHTYTSAGTRTVSLEVDDGTTTDTDTCEVEVLPAKSEERVYHVINLNASGAGSFAGCLSRANSDNAHSRIVFDVNGTISPGTSLDVTEDYTTICGTEAPGNGITINFGGFGGSSGIDVDASNCRFCNIHITQTEHNTDGLNIQGSNNVIERCTFTWCRDEGISLIGGHGNIAAFNRIEFCGSQPPETLDDGRGLSAWVREPGTDPNSESIVVGNYIGDNLRGALCGDYQYYAFMDFRNNLVTLNHQTFGLKVSTYGHVNIIDNTIINNADAGIKYTDGTTFYRSGNILYGNGQNENFSGSYTEVFSVITKSDTPYPDWLKNVTTPTDKTQVGMGTGKCQCVLCR